MTSASSLSAERDCSRADKLRFLKSPVVGGDGDGDRARSTHAADLHDDGLPRFERHEEPTLLEIFFDLFFAANYNVFSDTQQVTNHARFKAYTGYFSLLWVTWFVVTLFDVRYVTDSIFARITRAIQLGVLVGFAVVAPKFDPTDQKSETMRTMSLILMFSRACLAIEYGFTLWHVTKFPKARLPLCLQIAIHSAAAIVYFGVSFCFRQDRRSRAFMTWYFISGAEAILSLLLSNISPVLSLTRTHLMKRMTLLTVMIMGDGIIAVAKEVLTIVRNPDAWNSLTIGLLTAAVATIYFVFLVYFDWLRACFYLPAWRQQAWTSIHFPFHLSLVLFMQGFTQYLLWSKIVDQLNLVTQGLNREYFGDIGTLTSEQMQQHINASVQQFFREYPPKIQGTWDTVNAAIANVTQIPDSFWPVAAEYFRTDNETLLMPFLDTTSTLTNLLTVIMTSEANALFATFGIDLGSDIVAKNPGADKDVVSGGLQGEVQDKTWNRYRLIFAYGYIASGCTLFFMVVLTILARTTPLKRWPVMRLVIILLLALGIGLTATLFFNETAVAQLLQSPWVMPPITLAWTVVLVITHINGQGIKRHANFFRLGHRRLPPYDRSAVPLTPTADWAAHDGKAAESGRPADVDADLQHRFSFYRRSHQRQAARHNSHGADESGAPCDGCERPQSIYDPLTTPTDYKGARRG